jgi:hypothetical protein
MPTRRPDTYTLAALTRGTIRVDIATGNIYRQDQHGDWVRAETPNPTTGAGRVTISTSSPRVVATAHRVVWLAIHGPIPDRALVKHRNGKNWDNRPENLYLAERT